ncbi:MAG: hypothetical protein JSY10_23735 [Paenibacillus sp.]|nr:hypothetical protein [Paenibacillus sp.]
MGGLEPNTGGQDQYIAGAGACSTSTVFFSCTTSLVMDALSFSNNLLSNMDFACNFSFGITFSTTATKKY